MTSPTAADFAAARFAEHPDGAPYTRADPGASYPWIGTVRGTICRFSDEYAAENGWRIVTPALDPSDPDVIEQAAERARAAFVGDRSPGAMTKGDLEFWSDAVRAVLTPPPVRDPEAVKLEAVLRGELASILDEDGRVYSTGTYVGALADRLVAARGVRVGGGEDA